jgi:hypothetical protein
MDNNSVLFNNEINHITVQCHVQYQWYNYYNIYLTIL